MTVTTPAGATPENRTPPALTGASQLNGTLQCGTGTWNGTYTYTYRWLRDGTPIAGAHGGDLHDGLRRLGHALRCEVPSARSAR